MKFSGGFLEKFADRYAAECRLRELGFSYDYGIQQWVPGPTTEAAASKILKLLTSKHSAPPQPQAATHPPMPPADRAQHQLRPAAPPPPPPPRRLPSLLALLSRRSPSPPPTPNVLDRFSASIPEALRWCEVNQTESRDCDDPIVVKIACVACAADEASPACCTVFYGPGQPQNIVFFIPKSTQLVAELTTVERCLSDALSERGSARISFPARPLLLQLMSSALRDVLYNPAVFADFERSAEPQLRAQFERVVAFMRLIEMRYHQTRYAAVAEAVDSDALPKSRRRLETFPLGVRVSNPPVAFRGVRLEHVPSLDSALQQFIVAATANDAPSQSGVSTSNSAMEPSISV